MVGLPGETNLSRVSSKARVSPGRKFMKIIYVNCEFRNEYESDLRSIEHYISSSGIKAWKNSGLNRILTHDHIDTGTVLNQLS